MGLGYRHIDWRIRAAAWSAGAALWMGFIALLLTTSHTTLPNDGAPRGVVAIIDIAPQPQDRTRAPRVTRTPSAAASTPGAPTVEAEMLARMLACFDRRRDRDPNCPREPAPQDRRSPQIAVGGDFAQPPPVDFDAIYTTAELRTLVMPSCMRDGSNVCIRFGVRPPPPSRSAEEVCQDGGIGPCRPPPFEEAAPE